MTGVLATIVTVEESNTYSECVFVALGHAMRISIFSSVACTTLTFFHIISCKARFEGGRGPGGDY